MNKTRLLPAAAALLCSNLVGTGAQAANAYTGQIEAFWSAPVLSGVVVDPALGDNVAVNNTDTAQCNLAGCPVQLPSQPPSVLTWGSGTASPNFSTVAFNGYSFADLAPDTWFAMGEFVYTNGTSGTQTLMFGASLTLQAMGTNGAISDPFLMQLGVATTRNTGSPAQNADFVDFGSAVFGTTSRVSFNVLEGETATAVLYGMIVGDPQLQPTALIIAPGSAQVGFVGNGVPQAVPEPSSWALVGVAAAAAAAVTRRRRHQQSTSATQPMLL